MSDPPHDVTHDKTTPKQASIVFEVVKVKETSKGKTYTFRGASTLPDRARGKSKSGESVVGEVLSKNVLDKLQKYINDSDRIGGKWGSYRTISLFHDRVKTGDYTLEEAGFVVPGSAVVKEMTSAPGHYELLVDVEVNDHYVPQTYPDYTPDKIHYKIEKGAMGLSIEYDNAPEQERVVTVDGERYNYVFDTDDFRGFGFARPNLLGNPTAVRVKEITLNGLANITKEGEAAMEDAKMKEIETKLAESSTKLKELQSKFEAAEKLGVEGKAKEMEKEMEAMQLKVKELECANDVLATKLKESLERAFAGLQFQNPLQQDDSSSIAPKIKEVYGGMMKVNQEENDFIKIKETFDAQINQHGDALKNALARDGLGIDFEKHQTLAVKCKGSQMVVVPTAKTKDVLDTSVMAESTYNQAAAMFADRYVAGITETFLKNDNLLKVLPKEQFMGGNNKYQWKLWIDFETVSGDNTLAIDPDVTAVTRTVRKFEKMETRICVYQDGCEVTDFTQFHSAAAVGDLLGIELQRAAEAVTNSMASDLFKPKSDATTGWLGFIGLIGYADSSTYSTLFNGKTRSATNRLSDGTLANTFVTTSEGISASLIRSGYEKVLAHGSQLNDIIIVAHPTQVRRLFDAEDASIRHQILTMAGAPASWGFSRALIPHLDGIPIIRDYYCEDSAGDADMFAVVDISRDKGLNLVVSKPLGARGLAKVGTSESAYVCFWGAAVYKSPRNVFVHTNLTAT